ncbi:MAG: tetratricopeptide repeat protein [Acaryochloridaceae cyanobacterium SU_2_1]|nr:tetratricopeptide repeat protein [Acaryochloridaceae cyanobacterium SU_2_1]
MTLSLCMIVKDEALRLHDCLSSVEALVDEMVVLDTGSTDGTVAIATQAGARVYHYCWCDDFAAARNQALQYVQTDWVLVLDADETLVEDIIPQIQGAIAQPDYLAITLLRQEVGAAQSPYSMVSRLFRNHPQIQFVRPYHEWIDESVLALQQQEQHWQIGYLPGIALKHTGYQADIIARQHKHQRACKMMAAALVQQPQDAYLCSKLGALYGSMGQVKAALDLLQRGLEIQPLVSSVAYELHFHLGNIYTQLGESAFAEQHYQQALDQDLPSILKLGAYNNWANLLKAQGQLTAACRLYQDLIDLQPDLALAYYNLGLTLREQGDLEAAIAAYRQAIKHQPNYADAYQNLGVALYKQGKSNLCRTALERAIALHLQQDNPQEADRLRQGLTDLGLAAD